MLAVGNDSQDAQQLNLLEMSELQMVMQQLVVKDCGEDSVVWRPNLDGVFSAHLWKTKAPSKILFISWRFILDKLATKDQLVKRGILVEGNESKCVFCLTEDETLWHLFSSCVVFKGIWRRVYGWSDIGTTLSIVDL